MASRSTPQSSDSIGFRSGVVVIDVNAERYQVGVMEAVHALPAAGEVPDRSHLKIPTSPPAAPDQPPIRDTVGSMTRRVLVVVTAPDPSDELIERLGHHGADDVEVAVVAPASDESFLEWVTVDEETARREAARRARDAAEVEALAANVVDVAVGDPDPLVAVEDALMSFPADELIVVTRPKDKATWLEKAAVSGELERFGLPVVHIVDDDVGRRPDTSRTALGPTDGVSARVVRKLLLAMALCSVFVAVTVLIVYFSVR